MDTIERKFESLAVDCDQLVRDCWRYTPDDRLKDRWEDYSDFLTMDFDIACAKNPWAIPSVSKTRNILIKNDCDAQAFTTLSLMYRKGFPLNRLFVGGVYANEKQQPEPDRELIPNHAVGMVKFENFWRIVGDTFSASYRMHQQPFKYAHKFIWIGSYTNPTIFENFKE